MQLISAACKINFVMCRCWRAWNSRGSAGNVRGAVQAAQAHNTSRLFIFATDTPDLISTRARRLSDILSSLGPPLINQFVHKATSPAARPIIKPTYWSLFHSNSLIQIRPNGAFCTDHEKLSTTTLARGGFGYLPCSLSTNMRLLLNIYM